MAKLNEEVYTRMAKDVKNMQIGILELTDLINAATEAGIDTSALIKKKADLLDQVNRWVSVLSVRGYL